MQVSARLKGARLSAQKVRLVADQIRGKGVEEARELLTYSTKKELQSSRRFWILRSPTLSITRALTWTN